MHPHFDIRSFFGHFVRFSQLSAFCVILLLQHFGILFFFVHFVRPPGSWHFVPFFCFSISVFGSFLDISFASPSCRHFVFCFRISAFGPFLGISFASPSCRHYV